MRDELQIVLTAAQELPAGELPHLLGELEEIRCTAMARLTAPTQPSGADELLSVEEASRRLGVSQDYLYRHSSELSFTRRIGRKLLFSSSGINQYIRRHDGLTAQRHRLTLK
jgi:excisionase family DNA binding protein